MPAACVRTTRPATDAELALVREQGRFRGALGCLAVPLAFVLFGSVAVAGRVGYAFTAAVIAAILIVFAIFARSMTGYLRPIRERIRQDVANGTVEILAITSAAPLNIPGMHSSVDPAFAIDLEGDRTLVLLGQWLSDPATFGSASTDLPADDDAGDAFANGLPPPCAFPTSAFTVERFPVSGTVLRIGLAGDYVAPADLAVDLRPVNDYPSRLYEAPASRLSEVLPKQAGQDTRAPRTA
jgi:hypothetical protein